jgi:hypothetical protein
MVLNMGREDDRRIFTRDIKLNVLALQSTQDLNLPEQWRKLALNKDANRGVTDSIFDDTQTNLADALDNADFNTLHSVLALFEQAKTLGSLIQVPDDKAEFLHDLKNQLQILLEQGDSFQKPAATVLLPFVQQASLLAQRYDAVIANPPYMGGKGMNAELKAFAQKHFPDSKSDLFAMFIERGFGWCKPTGFNSMVTMQSWMFLSSYQAMRENLLDNRTLSNMVHMGNSVMGIAFGTAATVFWNNHLDGYEGSFSYCENKDINEYGVPKQFPAENERLKTVKPDDFKKIPGSPVAYWIPKKLLNVYSSIPQLYESTISDGQNITAVNEKYVRFLWEIDCCKLGTAKKWIYYAKGGPFRRWFGNNDYVVDWDNEAKLFYRKNSSARIIPEYLWFKPGITWTLITSSRVSFRLLHEEGTFDKTGSSVFMQNASEIKPTLAFLNSCVSDYLIKIFSSTVALQVDEVRRLPFRPADWCSSKVVLNTDELCAIAKKDWDLQETSRDFLQLGWTSKSYSTNNISEAWAIWEKNCSSAISRTQLLERENNCFFIEAYGLQGELSPEVPEDQITLTRADLEKDCQRLISYAIGCMVGRYQLDKPGLIYAHAGNVDFESIYNGDNTNPFPPDDDGIIPLTDQEWFKDDATNRFREFVRTVWGEDNLQLNLDFVAESLCLSVMKPKKSESNLETIRRYMSTQFYKDHLKTYKKRPIYWLFSSGKQKAFECLVYLHRYNESTLSRMRTVYVTPLLGKYDAFADLLKKQLGDATTSESTILKKELAALERKQSELRAFDDHLKHYADMRIKLDLDDGVKFNYGKFGDLLAEVKAITGGKE